MLAKDFKRGTILNYNGAPCMIENITVQTPSARGATTLYKFRARNLVTKNKVDFTFKGTDNLEEADFKQKAFFAKLFTGNFFAVYGVCLIFITDRVKGDVVGDGSWRTEFRLSIGRRRWNLDVVRNVVNGSDWPVTQQVA